MDKAQLVAEALALPADERFRLAQRLWKSCEGSEDVIEAIEDSIATQRDAEMGANAEATVSAAQALAEARKRLAR